MTNEEIVKTIFKNKKNRLKNFPITLWNASKFNQDVEYLKTQNISTENLNVTVFDTSSPGKIRIFLFYSDYIVHIFATVNNYMDIILELHNFTVYYDEIDSIQNNNQKLIINLKDKSKEPFLIENFRYSIGFMLNELIDSILQQIKVEELILNTKQLEFDKAIKEEKWEKLLSLADDYIDYYKNETNFYLIVKGFIKKTIALGELKRIDKANENNNITKSLFYKAFGKNENNWNNKCKFYFGLITYYEGLMFLEQKQYEKAIWKLNKTLQYRNDDKSLKVTKDSVRECYEKMINNFEEVELYKRKIIYISSEIPQERTETILPLNINYIKGINFPVGHPQKGELYVAHPLRPNVYYHIDNHEDMLWNSQTMELNIFLQNLGATEIINERSYGSSNVSSSNLDNSGKSNSSKELKIGGKVLKARGNFEHNTNSSQSHNTNDNIEEKNASRKKTITTQEFKPYRKPFIADDLIWFHHNETWQSLAQQRLSGGLLNSELVLSSNSISVINDNEKIRIEKDYERLIKADAKIAFVKLNGSHKKTEHSELEVNSKISITKRIKEEWKIKVKFAPINEIVEIEQSSNKEIKENEFSEVEQRYIDAVNFSLSDDGVIEAGERRRLERNRKRFEISEERAKELENIAFKSQYTEEEYDFLDELKAILEEEGQIDEDDRLLLSRLQKELNITDARAKELENMVFSKK